MGLISDLHFVDAISTSQVYSTAVDNFSEGNVRSLSCLPSFLHVYVLMLIVQSHVSV